MKTIGITIRRGFTLVELMVVLGIMCLLASLAVPSMVKLFTAGADSRAYNLLASQLAAARSVAILNQTYAAVHFQMADPSVQSGKLAGKQYMAIFQRANDVSDSTTYGKFILADGYDPIPVPGTYVFGQVSTGFISSNSYANLDGDPNTSETHAANFLNFNIVFSPSGSIVQAVDGNNISFDTSITHGSIFVTGDAQLWGSPTASAVIAVTMFDLTKFLPLTDSSKRIDFLNDNGQFIPLNLYTGQLYPRQ